MRSLVVAALLVVACAKSSRSAAPSEASGASATAFSASSVATVPAAPVSPGPAPVAGASSLAPPSPSPAECASSPDSGGCLWQREDRTLGLGDRASGTDAAAALRAMETRRNAVFACVARTQPGSALSEELRLRVRLRATFEKGRIVSALFQTETMGYGFIDKYRHVCIVEALSSLRLRPAARGEDIVVTYTYTMADAGTP